MGDPFRIEGPAVISFSGGRTSGYMLHRILAAHGGKLPDDVVVCFANTGKEMPETLDFVRDVSERWATPIVWLEYASGPNRNQRFRVVDYTTACRNGEPFEALIRDERFLPNPVARICTVNLKILAIARYQWARGVDEWDSIVGIRADEPARVAKVRANPSGGTRGVTRLMPLVDANVSKWVVRDFWRAQPFDLDLPNIDGTTPLGNCDCCFLKDGKQVLSIIREMPARGVWWARMETIPSSKPDGGRFRKDRPGYEAMRRMALDHGELFDFDDALEDCACTD